MSGKSSKSTSSAPVKYSAPLWLPQQADQVAGPSNSFIHPTNSHPLSPRPASVPGVTVSTSDPGSFMRSYRQDLAAAGLYDLGPESPKRPYLTPF